MLRRLLAPTLLLAVLGACSRAPEPAAPSADATPAATMPAGDTGATEATPTAASSPAGAATADAGASAADAGAAADSSAQAPTAPPAGAALVPRLGTDYFVLESPQPLWSQAPKQEIAEVFSYRCIHCAEFQPKVDAWQKHIPADARWEYVPGVFGGPWDDFARAFFAAEVLGVRERTHDAVFRGVFQDNYLTTGNLDDIAAMYARWGVDKAQFLNTMQSFGVTAKLNRAKQFALRTGVDATPTIIINGKYRVSVTTDRGFDGMLSTVEWLLARERSAAASGASAAAPAAAAKAAPTAG
jgi:thiol:disulfide interchange protein DsbA